LVMTLAFGYFSRLLMLFLVDIDVLYVLRITKEVTHNTSLAMPIAVAVVVLMAIALYLASALALANASGRSILPIGGPVFTAVAAAAPEMPRHSAPPISHYPPADAAATLRLSAVR